MHLSNRVLFGLAAGTLAGASAAIFTRYAQAEGMPSLLIAAFRLTLSTILLTPFVFRNYRHEVADLLTPARRSDLRWAMLAGALLAVHFIAWISSLEYASVLIATVLVTSSPIWTGLIETLFFKVRLTRWVILGVATTLVGNVVLTLAGGGSGGGPNMLLGGALALFAAITVAVHRTVSRPLRMKMSLLPFMWVIYSSSSLVLIGLVIVTGTPVVGFPLAGYFWAGMLTIFPHLIGHTAYNYVLRFMPATFVSLAIQIQPIFSTIAALLLFGEQPVIGQIIGSIIIMAGVFGAITAQMREGEKARTSSTPPETSEGG
ncbi:MAG: DMT family transporter [Chloroflexi bacterium]|nr:DMT family transporter [Chloroflexota bacterium]